jgi:dihydrodipicolinate synthase/N-acetylneuraminate lyase
LAADLTGVIPILVTPFTADGRVSLTTWTASWSS